MTAEFSGQTSAPENLRIETFNSSDPEKEESVENNILFTYIEGKKKHLLRHLYERKS